MSKKQWITFIFTFTLPFLLFAETPMVTDRPDFTESAETVPVKWIQIESGITQTRMNDIKELSIGELLFRIGVLNNLEIRVGLNSYAKTTWGDMDESGLTDSDLGLKWKFLKGCPLLGTHAALLVGTALPTGADFYTADKTEPYAKLALAWDLTESLALGSNLNYASLSAGDDRYNELAASLSLGVGINDKTGTYVEAFGFFPDLDGLDNTTYLNGGLTYSIRNNFQLDIRYGLGINDKDTDDFIGLGVVYRLPQ